MNKLKSGLLLIFSAYALGNSAQDLLNLNKIESVDGIFAINLSYQQEKHRFYTFSTQSMDGNKQYPYATDQREGYLVKNTVEGVRLSQISFLNGKVDFIPATVVREDLSGYNPKDIIETTNTEAKALREIHFRLKACAKFPAFFFHLQLLIKHFHRCPVLG
ncbi:hypothetical protein [Sphingobacterium siyangense]|uniref:hypothetical protein n=1 Tax=Sphingobacterium siyangense TaxID=459529 RepID=UPI002FDE689B